MPGCLEVPRKMTGFTSSGPPQPAKDAAPKAEQLRRKLAFKPQLEQLGQPMQLTPLWEHVVRTRQFPASVDVESIFSEIFDRLRDPEWEVRQHALRVLVDVLPVLEQNLIDKLMISVIPEVVTNLGHPAPAVRKGALDTLRVYLCCTQNGENMFHKILNEGFNRSDALDNVQSNVSMGMILSIPSLLFPSSGSPKPSKNVVKFAINALASRLAELTHQEAALRSLARTREIIGAEEFDIHMLDYNVNVKRDFEILCDIYNLKTVQDLEDKSNSDEKNEEAKEIVQIIKQLSTDRADSSRAADDRSNREDDQENVLGSMPSARVVLETEIKFGQKTAITMTILEEKDKKIDTDEATSDSDSDSDNFNPKDVGVIQVLEDTITERRNTRRRVRFGGEIVKLRTPDSDEASLDTPEVPKTKIPLPLFPATKMPLDHHKIFSQPTSPVHSEYPKKHSLSNNLKKEIYMHNALLSPKKSILTRSSSPVHVIEPFDLRTGGTRNQDAKSPEALTAIVKNQATLKQFSKLEAPNKMFAVSLETEKKSDEVLSAIGDQESLSELKRKGTRIAKGAPGSKHSDSDTSQQVDISVDEKGKVEGEYAESRTKPGKKTPPESPKRSSHPSNRVNFDIFPKQERNYILMELSSPERKKNTEKKISANDFPFGQMVNEASFNTNIAESKTEATMSDRLLNQIIDSVPTPIDQTARGSETTITKNFSTTFKSDLPNNTCDVIVPRTVQASQSEKSSQDSSFLLSTNSNSHIRNLQNSKERLDQLEDHVEVTSATSIENEEREKGVNFGNSADKNHRIRELPISDRHIRSAPDQESESLTCSSSEGEENTPESSWEELGLVGQEILDDLHNKYDWRARVRGLERTASALRTSSALLIIEPRLGSLLQAVLGGERSSRIAAAGMAVAKVLISGVSEDALRQRLPQLAWGLARHGGPHAAQLARIAMLRLRPALLLEQLLQPHCLGARNGKTRENALQLLIFSLVTFPSTEFKVQMVARRVAETIGDRRRRVRQAALDTLAVLGQIYEVEEVLEAGERAASGRHDGDAMKAAIRSRLARKSLPLVSADGLVVYGLQISPNVRIATGADVDWIVAGNGSLSPGSGRSRGQLTGTTARLDSANIFRSESARSNPWTDRPDILAVGTGMGHRKSQQPSAWQLVPIWNQAQLKGNLLPQEESITQVESRIPVLCSRERGPSMQEAYTEEPVRSQEPRIGEASRSGVTLNEMTRRMAQSSSIAAADRSNFNRFDSRDGNVGYASMYQRRRRLVERNASQALQLAKEIPNHFSVSKQHYELDNKQKKIPERAETGTRTVKGRADVERSPPVRGYSEGKSALPGRVTGSNRSTRSLEGKDHATSRSQERHDETELKTTLRNPKTLQAIQDTYGTMYQRRRRIIEGNAFLALQATPNRTSYYSQRIQPNLADRCSRSKTLKESVQKLPRKNRGVTDIPTVNLYEINVSRESVHTPEKELRRPRTRMEEKGLERDNRAKMRIPLEHNPDEAVEDDEDHDIQRRHASSRSSVYEVQCATSRNSHYQVTRPVCDTLAYDKDAARPTSIESSNSSISVTESHRSEIQRKIDDNRHSQTDNQSRNSATSHNGRSSTPLSQAHQKKIAFDVVPFQTVPNRQNSVNSYLISMSSTKLNLPEESIAVEIFDEDSSSSDIDVEQSIQDKLSHDCENPNAEDDTDDTFERNLTRMQDSIRMPLSSEESDQFSRKASRESVCSLISLRKCDDSLRITHSFQQFVKKEPSTPSQPSPASKASRETIASERSIERVFLSYDMRTNESSQNVTSSFPQSSEFFAKVAPDSADEERKAIFSPTLPDDSDSLQSLGSRSFQELDRPELYSSSNSASIVRSSHSRSNEHIELEDDARRDNVQLHRASVSLTELGNSMSSLRAPSAKIVTPMAEPMELLTLNNLNPHETLQSRDELDIPNVAASRIGQSLPLENELPRNQSSKVPRMKPKLQVNSMRSNQISARSIIQSSEKLKPSVQLCLTQLESKDWEVITKGLKTLSQIARQNPAQLDQCGPGTLGRVLGRHVRNLRSQVSRAACLAAGDVFSSQPKSIEQEIDDIAGPLLHRTADTNKFLRADSNMALDRLVENVPPHKIIGVIVHRGATHQNAIVRATTARLLSDIVSRIGPEQAMTLPREVRDKLLVTGAKLLIDGNLDARNSAKKMFRSLLHCEGFQKVLMDTVPETTLRHIDKTLRTL